MTAPIGKAATFNLHKRTRLTLWKLVVVQHVADPFLAVGGKRRPTIKLRIVRHDALGRHRVQAERLYWLDRVTGIPLKKQVVVRMADGNIRRITIWQVASLGPAVTRSGAARDAVAEPGQSNADDRK